MVNAVTSENFYETPEGFAAENEEAMTWLTSFNESIRVVIDWNGMDENKKVQVERVDLRLVLKTRGRIRMGSSGSGGTTAGLDFQTFELMCKEANVLLPGHRLFLKAELCNDDGKRVDLKNFGAAGIQLKRVFLTGNPKVDEGKSMMATDVRRNLEGKFDSQITFRPFRIAKEASSRKYGNRAFTIRVTVCVPDMKRWKHAFGSVQPPFCQTDAFHAETHGAASNRRKRKRPAA